jgi:predicted MFS family arabinose efflux permease
VGFWLIPKYENSVGWHASFIVLCVTDLVALIAALWLTTPLSPRSTRLSFGESLPNVRGALALASVVLYYIGVCAIYAFAYTIGSGMTGSDGTSGSLLSASQVVGMVGCALAALIAGRFPRRPAIVLGFVVTIGGICFLLLGAGTASFAIGLFAINFAWNFLAGSHIAAVGTMDDRGSAAAFLAVAINGGAALGPLLGFTVSGEDYVALETTAIALVAVALVLILVALQGRPEFATRHALLEEPALEQ